MVWEGQEIKGSRGIKEGSGKGHKAHSLTVCWVFIDVDRKGKRGTVNRERERWRERRD